MNIRKEASGDTAKYYLEGRLDTTTAPELEAALQESGDIKALVLDFEKLSYISSAGLRVLLSAQKRANASGSTMTLKNGSFIFIFPFLSVRRSAHSCARRRRRPSH